MGKIIVPEIVVIGFQVRDASKKNDYGGRILPRNPQVNFTDVKLLPNEYWLVMFIPLSSYLAKDAIYDKWNKWINKSIIPVQTTNLAVPRYRILNEKRHASNYFSPGKVRWRVETSLGFQFEIKSSAVSALVDSCILCYGVIQDNCVLSFSPTGTVALISQHSIAYAAHLKEVAKLAKKNNTK